MTEAEVFVLADTALNDVVQQIRADQWDMTMPDWFQVASTQGVLTLRQVINYHAYDELWVPATLSGKAVDDPSMPDREADHLGDEPQATFAELTKAGIAAVQAATDLDRKVHLTYGDWPAREYLLHITSFRGFRVFDLSKAIGIDTRMPDDLVQAMWDELAPHFDEWRQWGVYKPAVDVPADASLQDKLIAGSGRDPK